MIFASILIGCVSTGVAQYTNGIYAEFNTSMGSYTCRLEYATAPKATANFIGLATGQRAWLDLPSGVVKTVPFYNGTTMHRVVADFMNQGGSPNGQGTDGPAYSFVDEFSPSLRHDGFGVLSMANSGPDSNGSQYFITVGPTPWLDDVHTVFGRLYGGSNVVYAINRVATDGNDKPLTNVMVQSVVIRRVGTAAAAFDINAQGLPLVNHLHVQIAAFDGSPNVKFTNQINCNARIYRSTNLLSWRGINFGYETGVSQVGGLVPSMLLPREFFRGVQVQYPPALFTPRYVYGRTLTLNFSGGNGTFVLGFSGSGGETYGTYTSTIGASGQIIFYSWTQDPYRGRLLPLVMENFGYIMELHLDYDSASAGTFKGTGFVELFYPSPIGSFPVSGTFTSSP